MSFTPSGACCVMCEWMKWCDGNDSGGDNANGMGNGVSEVDGAIIALLILFLWSTCDSGVMACSLFSLLHDDKEVYFVDYFFFVILSTSLPEIFCIFVLLFFLVLSLLLLSALLFWFLFLLLTLCIAEVFIFSRYYVTRFLIWASSGWSHKLYPVSKLK